MDNRWAYLLAVHSNSRRPAPCLISQQLNLGTKAGDSFLLNAEWEKPSERFKGSGIRLSAKKSTSKPVEKWMTRSFILCKKLKRLSKKKKKLQKSRLFQTYLRPCGSGRKTRESIASLTHYWSAAAWRTARAKQKHNIDVVNLLISYEK